MNKINFFFYLLLASLCIILSVMIYPYGIDYNSCIMPPLDEQLLSIVSPVLFVAGTLFYLNSLHYLRNDEK